MMGYSLEVFYPERAAPERVECVSSARETLSRMSALLAGYPACEKVVVRHGLLHLFAVDGKGNRLPD